VVHASAEPAHAGLGGIGALKPVKTIRHCLAFSFLGSVLMLAACGSSDPDGVTSSNASAGPDPYGEEVVNQAFTFTASDGALLRVTVRGDGELRPRPLIMEFSPYGIGSDIPDFGAAYNHVRVEARGTGQSSGVWTAVGPNDQRDVSEVVAWACTQPWSNGHIGLYGFSASAIAVYNSMHLPLDCVDAAALMAGTNDLYRDLLYPGGSLNMVPGAAVGLGVGVPIVIGGMLNLLQEQDLVGGLSSVFSGVGFLGTVTAVLLNPIENTFWIDRTQRPGPNRFPVLADTGFYDVESRGPFESYKMLRDLGVPVHLIVYGAHDGFPVGTPGPFVEYQRWFDHYLLGRDTGVERDARVRMLIGHGSYEAQIAGAVTHREADDWPVPGTRWQTLYLDPARGNGAVSINDGRLSVEPSTQQARQSYPSLISLPTASDPNTTSIINQAGAGTLFELLPFLTELNLMSPLSLTYSTAPLQHDVDIVGPASLSLHVSTLLPEADLLAVIADVWPDGSAHAVGIGRLRTSFPNLVEARSVYDTNGEVIQPYPDHSEKSYARPLEMREYKVEFWPIGNRFEAGHSLRLFLMGAPAYELPALNLNSVYVGGQTSARLTLPVLPGSDLLKAIASP
jgi:predicted acyl esterase